MDKHYFSGVLPKQIMDVSFIIIGIQIAVPGIELFLDDLRAGHGYPNIQLMIIVWLLFSLISAILQTIFSRDFRKRLDLAFIYSLSIFLVAFFGFWGFTYYYFIYLAVYAIISLGYSRFISRRVSETNSTDIQQQ